MSRPVLIRPSDRATVGGGAPPISAALIPRLHKDIPESGSDPYGSMTYILWLLTLRMAGSEGHPTAPTIRFPACRPPASVILSVYILCLMARLFLAKSYAGEPSCRVQ